MSLSTGSPKRFIFIDALRGWAALAVLVFHSIIQVRAPLPGLLLTVNEQGARGVQLFYILSAFTLFLSLESRTKRHAVTLKKFFLRRFFRIAPLFYVALGFYLWLYGRGARFALGDRTAITSSNILSNIFFFNDFNPYWINSIVPVGWSVAVEVSFYCLVPLLFSKIRSLSQAIWLTLATLIFGIVINRFLYAHPLVPDPRLWREFLFLWPVNQLAIFCLGIVLFFLHKNQTIITPAFGKLFLALAIFLMAGLIIGNYPFLPKHFMYGIGFVLLTLGLAGYPLKIFVNRVTCFLGKISYSIYLTHVLGIRLAGKAARALALNSTPTSALLALVLLGGLFTVSISILTYWLIEQPGQKLGARIITYLAKPAESLQNA
jgi:peptidoglycan/LPS O-acetylase OafA/YrhL